MSDMPEPSVARRSGTGRKIPQPDVAENTDDVFVDALVQEATPIDEPTGVAATGVRAVQLGGTPVPVAELAMFGAAFVAVAVGVIFTPLVVSAAVTVAAIVAVCGWLWWWDRKVRWCETEVHVADLRSGMWIGRNDQIVAVRAVRRGTVEVVFTTTDHVQTKVSVWEKVECAHVWWPAGTVAARDRVLEGTTDRP